MKRAVLLTMLILFTAHRASAQADYVLHGGRIYTVNPEQPVAQALAVRGDRILMVGSNDEILAAYPDAKRQDLDGLTVIPGLIDAHAHLMGRALALMQVDLVGTSSKEEILQRLTEFASELSDENEQAMNALPAETRWLTGRGWDQNDWPDQEYPTREDLDAVFPDRPVWLRRIDGHAAWGNTAALSAAGRDRIRDAADPEGGKIVRDENGNPTGIFIDTAMNLVDSRIPLPTTAERSEGLRLALEETARNGLTGIHDAGVDREDIQLYKEAIDKGRFDIRLYGMISGTGATFEQLCREGAIRNYGDRLTVRSVKLYIDGALGSRGAALLEPYTDEPGSRGLLRSTPEEFTAQVTEAMACGFQVNTHAIGDRGNRVVLDAYESAIDSLGLTAGRHRIEHAQIVDLDDIPRFRSLGLIASMQPTHATSDMYWAEERIGEKRLEGAYAWRSFLDAGVPIAFGSDFPVEDVNPLLGFYAAVTRQDVEGWPEGGWLAYQRTTRLEALKGFTLGAAYAAFQEHDLGSIEPGKLADFVVLSRDIMTVPAAQIPETEVLATFLGGEAVYEHPGWSDLNPSQSN